MLPDVVYVVRNKDGLYWNHSRWSRWDKNPTIYRQIQHAKAAMSRPGIGRHEPEILALNISGHCVVWKHDDP